MLFQAGSVALLETRSHKKATVCLVPSYGCTAAIVRRDSLKSAMAAAGHVGAEVQAMCRAGAASAI